MTSKMISMVLLVVLSGAMCRVLSPKTEVSIYSKPVFVKGPDNIVVDGYPAKLGLPGSQKIENRESYDSFVDSAGIDDSVATVTSSLGLRVHASAKEPYRTPYIPLANSAAHKQIKRTTTTSPRLPDCTTQQVCNALYVRLNRTQNLCSCPPGVHSTCSTSPNSRDGHSVRLIADNTGKVLTMVKTCEPITEVRTCRTPTDWALLAIQNMRTGKAHYLVICRCPKNSRLYGPTLHPNPNYAKVPGINMYGMLCVSRTGRSAKIRENANPAFPWTQVKNFISYLGWIEQDPST